MNDITQILNQIENGDLSASEQLLPLVYDELRRLAACRLAQEKPGQTLQATALVHEAYLRLIGNAESDPQQWNGGRHFFGAAAQAMQRILVENARRKKRIKHGGERNREDLLEVPFRTEIPIDDMLTLDQALSKLQQQEPEKAEIVRLRFFVGLNHEQVGQILGVSTSTVRRHWRYARAWLRREMGAESGE